MRPFLIVILSLLFGCSSSYTTIISGTGDDRGVGLIHTGSGGLLVNGTTSSIGAGGQDGLLIRLDPDGVPLWTITLGDENDEAAWQVLETEEGFVVAGFGDGQFDSPSCELTLVSHAGDVVWQRGYDTPGRERCWGIAETEGGYALVGEVVGADEEIHDCLLIRTDENGKKLWSRTYDEGLQERCFAIARRATGGFLLAGQTTPDGGEERDLFLLGIDADGEREFDHVIGEEGIDLAHSITSVRGGSIIGGYTASFGADEVDPILIGMRDDGTIEWTERIAIDGNARGITIDADQDGSICVAGYIRNEEGTRPFLLRTNASGSQEWIETFDLFTIGYGVIADSSGGCTITGHISDDEGQDLFVARVSDGKSKAKSVRTFALEELENRAGSVRR